MSLPVGDWQFWVVTGLALAAVLWMLRGVVPVPFLTARYRRKKRERRVNLTVGGRTVK